MVSVYKPPAQDAVYFLTGYSYLLTYNNTYSITYEKQVIVGDFNLTPDNKSMREFVNLHNLINLIETTTCFTGAGYSIDFSLTNQKCSFKNTNTFETGLSDHHLLIYSMLRTSFQKNEPKRLYFLIKGLIFNRSVKFY